MRILRDVKSGRILVVDDQIELAENIAEVLQGLGFETVVASSAEDGLAVIKQGGITALVTDFKLPGRSGADLIADIRHAGVRIPALMMSAYTDERTIDASQAAGAWLFLPKPVPLAALMEAFRSLALQPAAALLLDDEVALTENVAEALTAAGHEIITSRTGEEALAQRRRRAGRSRRLSPPRRNRHRSCPPAACPRPRHPDLVHLGIRRRAAGAAFDRFAGSDLMEKPLAIPDVLAWLEGARKLAP